MISAYWLDIELTRMGYVLVPHRVRDSQREWLASVRTVETRL